MKFGADAPFQMIKVYKTAIENFIKARPREVSIVPWKSFSESHTLLLPQKCPPAMHVLQWVQLNAFRATRVEMELNFIEYVIDATHREMWQNIGPIKQSQADLASFSLEVTKKLGLKYHSPAKPIHLFWDTPKQPDTAGDSDGHNYGLSEVVQLFDNAEE